MSKGGQRAIPEAVRISTAASMLGLSRMQTDRLCSAGKLEYFSLDGVRFVWMDGLRELCRARDQQGQRRSPARAARVPLLRAGGGRLQPCTSDG